MASQPQTPQQPMDFAGLMPKVAKLLLGEPTSTSRTGDRLRFGSKGSMEIDTAEGWFDDHEAKVRGGVLELIRHREHCDTAGAFRWLEAKGLKEPTRQERRVISPTARHDAATFYDYCDEAGAVLYRVERRGKGATPPFLQHGPDGRGGFHSMRGCMQGVRRVPYRLPELVAADPAEPVFLCEGEKDADRVAAAGLIATTNPGGAGKFTRDLAAPLQGRTVIMLQDNDDAGAAHVAAADEALSGIAAKAVSLLLPGLPPKGDVSDWLAAGGSAFDLRRLASEAINPPAAMFQIADLAAWAQITPTPKAFLMAGVIPEGEVTLFTGGGGTNKSTFGLQLSACSAAGLPMLGVDVQPGPSLYVTAEDEDRENHWRLRKIASAVGTSLERLAGKLHVVSLRGRLSNELATFDNEGRLHTAPAFAMLRATIEATGSKLIVLDNVAHLFVGNENDRSHVTAFVNLLYQLCRDLGATVVLIGHPNKTGDTYSGSTAWLNAVRSQIVLARPEGGTDPDARVLSLGKANYARPDQQLCFRWHDFALIRDEDLPKDQRDELRATIQANTDNAAFLRCLAERNKQRRQVSEKATAANYAPKQFEGMPEAGGLNKKRLEAAMDRLFRIGAIERGFLYRDTGEGKDIQGLREVDRDAPETSPETSRKHLPEGTGNPQETTGNTPPYISYTPGAAHQAAAPVMEGAKADLSRPIFAERDPADDIFDTREGSGF